MIGDTFPITYDSVLKTLVKVNQDNYGSEYFLEDGTNRFTVTVKHTIPKKGSSGESHMARLDVEHYDGDGVLVRTCSSWTVVRTDVGIQDSASSELGANALLAELDAALITKLVGRES